MFTKIYSSPVFTSLHNLVLSDLRLIVVYELSGSGGDKDIGFA